MKCPFSTSPRVHLYDLATHGRLLRPLVPVMADGSASCALSLLPELGRFARLPPESIVGWSAVGSHARDEQDLAARPFWEQTAFVTFMHDTLGRFVDRGGDEATRQMAQMFRSGWMAIGDERALPPLNRQPDPDDIVGLVLAREGHLVRGSYQPMPTHRLLTHMGLFRLPSPLHEYVREELESRVREYAASGERSPSKLSHM